MKRTTEAYIVHHADFMAFLPFKNPKNIEGEIGDVRVGYERSSAVKETITARNVALGGRSEYTQLSQEAVYQAKRFLLDSVGCALGGYQQHDVKIALAGAR